MDSIRDQIHCGAQNMMDIAMHHCRTGNVTLEEHHFFDFGIGADQIQSLFDDLFRSVFANIAGGIDLDQTPPLVRQIRAPRRQQIDPLQRVSQELEICGRQFIFTLL